MKIGFVSKLNVLGSIYKSLFRLPKKYIRNTFLYPLDSTRYTEFAVFLDYLKKHDISIIDKKILDVSSPFMMAYILAERAFVTKTDINPDEKRSIKEHVKLKFEQIDGTDMPYKDNSFDMVYSISVIEHIYRGYMDAVQEMVRITKPGGLIYISTPVSKEHVEEWIEDDIYSHQHKKQAKTFFQYRFSKLDIKKLLDSLEGVDTKVKNIYWEKKSGAYDTMTKRMRKRPKNKYLEFLYMAGLNWWYGFTILESKPQPFGQNKSLGNISIILEKQ